jgi:2-keto-3-deoxy-L-fuconate dehydrogenase
LFRARLDFSFDLNVKSMHLTIKAFLPAMLQKRGGSSTFSQ